MEIRRQPLLYPRLSLSSFLRLLGWGFAGAAVAASYGFVHDQVTFTLGPEYFTRFKFHQFAQADFGLPDRIFVGLIGILATWWVGLLAGWILGRLALMRDGSLLPFRELRTGFSLILFATFVGGVFGGVFNEFTFDHWHDYWSSWSGSHGVVDVKAFARVGQVHNFGYLGSLIGLVVAGWTLRSRRKLAEQTCLRDGESGPQTSMTRPSID